MNYVKTVLGLGIWYAIALGIINLLYPALWTKETSIGPALLLITGFIGNAIYTGLRGGDDE